MSQQVTAEEIAKLAAGVIPGTCLILHNGSCSAHWLANFWHGFKFGMKFYFPLHFIPLLFRYRQVIKKPLETIRAALKGCVRSTMVLAVMVFIGKLSVCTYVRTFNSMDDLIMKITAALVTLASFIETPARISEMAMYVMPRFFDAFWKFSKRRELVVDLPGGQIVLFCLALSAIMYCQEKEPDNIKPMYKKACETFFGVN